MGFLHKYSLWLWALLAHGLVGFAVVTANVCLPPTAVSQINVTINQNGVDLVLAWEATNADLYDVWVFDITMPPEPEADCAISANCFTTTDASYTFFGTAGMMGGKMYQVVARCNCGSMADGSRPQAVFTYGLNGFTGPDMTDSDGDRLPDVWETKTAVFVNAHDTGTNPNLADTDGDGIDDGDEVLGTEDGLDLPSMGTNPLVKNILIEYDWFNDNNDPDVCPAHTHRPSEAVVARLADVFATANVPNPDGSTGIVLIQDHGQGGVFLGGNLIDDPNGVIAGGLAGPEFIAYKATHFAANRHGYFHYVFLPHRHNTNGTSSGQAEQPGDDAIVSLYCYAIDRNVLHTIMHELGHNLFLRHGGNNDLNYKPNYNSVMNYLYQFNGVDNDCTPPGNGGLNYSYGRLRLLDETNLDEHEGICGTPYAWDWNGNGVIEAGVAADINQDGFPYILNDYNDWANLVFTGIDDADSIPRLLLRPVKIIEEAPLPNALHALGFPQESPPLPSSATIVP